MGCPLIDCPDIWSAWGWRVPFGAWMIWRGCICVATAAGPPTEKLSEGLALLLTSQFQTSTMWPKSPRHIHLCFTLLLICSTACLYLLPINLKNLSGHETTGKIVLQVGHPQKSGFGAGDTWILPQIQGDQEPPGNTWRYPMGSKKFLLILNHIWATIYVL